MDVAVVGGGIAGLSAAFYLQRDAPDLDVRVIEGNTLLGGKILTERYQGFVIEAGPDSFLSSKPGGLDLCSDLGIDQHLEGPNDARRRTFIMNGGRLHDLPEGLTGLVPSRLEPMLTSDLFTDAGKARLLSEPDIPPRAGGADESLASFIERRFGVEVYERLVEPLMAGIYAGDGRQLSLDATFPQLRQIELQHGSVIKGLQAAQREKNLSSRQNRALPAFLTPRTGMQELVEALLAQLRPDSILPGAAVRRVEARHGGYQLLLEDGGSLQAHSLILATPAFIAAGLLESIDLDLADLLATVPYVSTATISVAYPFTALRAPLDGFGYIVPRRERRPILACTWTSSKFPDRAPDGFALIRCFVGRAGQEDALSGSDDDLLSLVRNELREVLGITSPPSIARVFRWPNAMPQYTLGHRDRLTAIAERLRRHPGLHLAGHPYRGVGIPDCVQSGRAAAVHAAQFLRAATSPL
jgi:oxygen-dependent protoporphyrinogen oxidase